MSDRGVCRRLEKGKRMSGCGEVRRRGKSRGANCFQSPGLGILTLRPGLWDRKRRGGGGVRGQNFGSPD